MVTFFRNSLLIIISSFSLIFSQNYILSFDGEDDYVEIESFELGVSFSFDTEFFLPEGDYGITDAGKTIFSYGPANDGWEAFSFGISSTGQHTSWNEPTLIVEFGRYNNYQYAANMPIDLNVSHHVLISYNEGHLIVYQDGIEVINLETLSELQDDGANRGFDIGRRTNDSQYFPGSINYLRIWNEAIGEDELIEILNGNEFSNDHFQANWEFDSGEGDILYDNSGNQNHGTIYGATWSTDVPPPPTTNWNNEHSLSFDGQDDYVQIADSDELDGMDNLTVQLWVKFDSYNDYSTGSEGYNILSKSQSTEGIGYALYTAHDEQRMTFIVRTENGQRGADLSDYEQHINLNQWHLITGVYDGNNVLIYIDGVLMGESSQLTGSVISNDYPIKIGSDVGSSLNKFFDGLIDEVSIMSSALNQEQIQSNMFSNLNGDEAGLLGYWRFEENNGMIVYDFSPNGNDGVIMGASWSDDVPSAPQEPPPPTGNNYSLSFDGVDDWVGYSNSYSFENNMTFQAWINPDGNGDYNQFDAGACIYSQGAQESVSYADFAVGLRTNFPNSNGNLRLVAEFGSNYNVVSDVTNLPTDSWTNVAVTYNNGNVNFYVNGELTSTSSVGINTLSNSNSNVFTGRRMSNNDGNFPGEIDELALWGNVLTSDQIQANMNTPLAGDETGLLGYWNFNDGEGSILTDLSGNGNHGTINGATWSNDGAPVQPLEELDTIATITLSDVDTYIFPGYIGDTALVAVNADLGDIDLFSSEMHFTGFQGVLGFEGIVTEGTPMGDADWDVIVNEQEEILITGNYGSDAISGDITLFHLMFSVGNSLAEDSIYIELAHVELNEEEGVIETMDGSVSVGHLSFGDVTMNDDVSMMDAANVLRYLVGSVDFDKYQMSAADVTMDESISALDASVVAQNAVGLVESLPHSEGTDGQGFLTINNGLEYQPGEILEVPIMLANGNNLLSFEVDLTYNPNQVTVEGIDWSDQIDHFMIEENNEPGSIRVAGSGTTPDGQEGLFATLRLQVLETTTEQTIDITINKIRINESAPVEDVMVSITQEVLSTDNATVPTVYALHQNYPNPFNPTTKISYDLPEASVVSLYIYDLMGREIRTMINSEQTAGFKNIQWNGTDNLGKSVPAGMYIYTIQAGEFRQTRKMVLLK